MADREKFDAWLRREGALPGDPHQVGVLHTCLGGPIDGMPAATAERMFTSRGASLIVPAQLVLQATPGEPERLAHHYARDHRGAFVYVGVVSSSEVPK